MRGMLAYYGLFCRTGRGVSDNRIYRDHIHVQQTRRYCPSDVSGIGLHRHSSHTVRSGLSSLRGHDNASGDIQNHKSQRLYRGTDRSRASDVPLLLCHMDVRRSIHGSGKQPLYDIR